MRRLRVAALLVLTGCASAPIKTIDAAALAAADAQVLEGCYDCLLAARDTYARIGVGRARPLVVGRLFETELLIALREKALALDAAASLARAQALVSELPPTIDAARLVAVAEAVLPDTSGTPVSTFTALRRQRSDWVTKSEAEAAWIRATTLTPAVAESIAVALECAHPPRRRPSAPGQRVPPRQAPEAAADAPPLVQFQVAVCGSSIRRPPLERIRAAVPAFVETSYFMARMGLATAKDDGGPGVRDQLAEVYTRFPTSPAITYVSGNYNQLIGDCKAALAFYDETLALESAHENAMLGRTICLSYLKRQPEAIASATRMIELKTYNVEQAYYWRAWNHHFLKDLDQARRDIESAKAIAATGEIFTLAGVIEHDQNDLAPAEHDLTAARNASYGSRNCVAAWYLGLVMMKRERFAESGTWFEHAMGCYEQNVVESEAGLQAMQNKADLDPDFKARQIANFEAAIKEDRSQYYASAFNAANQGARGGNLARARELIEIAAKDPALADLVRQLREILKLGSGLES